MIITELALVFPDRDTAIAVARALSGNPEVTEFPKDGWLEGTYYNIAEFGPLEGFTGWCLIGRWCGPDNTVPAALQPYRVDPGPFPVRFG